MSDKIFISANQLLEDSFKLGSQILDKSFRPDLIIGLWRGGAPVAIAIHELFAAAGFKVDHIALRTQLYLGLDQRGPEVDITGLEYIEASKAQFNKVLLVDDVFDSGSTMVALIDKLAGIFSERQIDIRIATVWYKPERNESDLRPHYFIHTTQSWLVFPHELRGVPKAELVANKLGFEQVKRHL